MPSFCKSKFFHAVATTKPDSSPSPRQAQHFPPFRRSRRAGALPRAALVLTSVAALLTGCMVGPDFERPAAPQTNGYTPQKVDIAKAAGEEEQQHLAMGQKISGDWWKLFRAQRLDAVIRRAIADNQTLAAAKATLAQAQTAVAQASGALLPRLDLSAGASRQRQNELSLGIASPPSEFNLYSIGPNISYTLDVFGGERRQIEQQEAIAQYQDYQLDAAYLTLTGNVVNQAVAIASARAQIDAMNAVIQDDEKNVQLVAEELKSGAVLRTDLEQAKSQLAADRNLLPPLQQQLATARDAMAVLVGQAPADWRAPDFSLDEFTLPADLPVSLPSALVRQRPDILAAEAQLHAASAAIGVATAQEYPQFNLTGSFLQESLSPHNMFFAEGTLWSIAAQMTAPIFHGGELVAAKQGAVEGFNVRFAQYKQTVLTSFAQVADTLQALENDAALVDGQRKALESAQTTLQLTRETFSSGNVSVLQVLDAQRLYEQARLGYARARSQRLLDSAQLVTAMGGGWWDWRNQSSPQASAQPLAVADGHGAKEH